MLVIWQPALWHRFRKGIFWWCDSLHCDLLRNKTVIWSDDMMKWHWATGCLRIRIFRCRSIRSIRLDNRCSSEVLSHLRNRRNPGQKKIKKKYSKRLSSPVVANPPKLLLSARQIFAMGHFHLQDLADLGNLSIVFNFYLILLFKVAYRIVRWFIPGSAILILT